MANVAARSTFARGTDRMKSRRLLLTRAGAFVLATPLMVLGQKKERSRRIGYVGGGASNSRFAGAFRDELRRLGYIDGETVAIDYRGAEGRLDRIPGFVQELIKSNVDVLVAENVVAIRAAQRETTTIPIAMVTSIDPVAAGFVQSLRRPGANITGLSTLRTDLCAKRLEMLRELIPGISRVAILWDTDGPGPQERFRDYLTAAKGLKVHAEPLEIKSANPDFETAFRVAVTNRVQALIVIGNPTLAHHRSTVMSLSLRYRLPTMAEAAPYVEAGGLLAYSADEDEGAKILAGIVAKILRGAHPKELPIEQSTKFEMIINMKTAKALGLSIPPTIMVQATRVIQ